MADTATYQGLDVTYLSKEVVETRQVIFMQRYNTKKVMRCYLYSQKHRSIMDYNFFLITEDLRGID